MKLSNNISCEIPPKDSALMIGEGNSQYGLLLVESLFVIQSVESFAENPYDELHKNCI